jgi:tetratricopeptide (TPR) repeat protein
VNGMGEANHLAQGGAGQDRCEVEITADGHLRLECDAARRFFPTDALVPLWRDDAFLLLPVRGSAAGGLILKQRNPRGDRCVLIAEATRQVPSPGWFSKPGRFTAIWDDAVGGLRLQDAAGIDRPQPVGLFPFPTSHLLLPATDSPVAEAARQSLLLGELAAFVPDEWLFFVAAARGQTAESLGRLGGDDAVTRYNRFVLAPTVEGLAAIESAGDPVLAALSRFAAFAHGLVDDLPEASLLDGELLAVALVTTAAARIEQGRVAEACQVLQAAAAAAAATSPVLAALMEMQTADLLAQSGGGAAAVAGHLKAAVGLAEHARLPLLQAELWSKLGIALQQVGSDGSRPVLLEAVRCYQRALHAGVTEADQPEWFAQIQNNLGLAYLSMPAREAGDTLRTGIAVQSFRQALKAYDRERDPDMWSSVRMNLASALQYLPSSHREENLMQAVEAYEEVLQVRTEARDPVAHARVLLNQSNALAHLGIFKPAIEKIADAYKLFSWHEHFEEAAAAKELHDQIARSGGHR